MKIDFTQENGQNRLVSLMWSEYVVRLYHEYFYVYFSNLFVSGVVWWDGINVYVLKMNKIKLKKNYVPVF